MVCDLGIFPLSKFQEHGNGSLVSYQRVFMVGGDWKMNGLEFYDFPRKYGECHVIPTDFHSMIFQRGRLKPPTR